MKPCQKNWHTVIAAVQQEVRSSSYNLRKLTHGQTIPPGRSNFARKNFLIRTDVYLHLSILFLRLYILIPCQLSIFVDRHFIYNFMCVYVSPTSLRSDSDCNKEATYLLSYMPMPDS